MRDHYDDGGFSGGSMERSALKKLLDAVRASAPICQEPRGVFSDINNFRGKGRPTPPFAMMHDFPQGLTNRFQVGDGHALPELIRLHPLDDLCFLTNRVEVHLERREAIKQFDLQVGHGSGFSKHSDLHARQKEIPICTRRRGPGYCATS